MNIVSFSFYKLSKKICLFINLPCEILYITKNFERITLSFIYTILVYNIMV